MSTFAGPPPVWVWVSGVLVSLLALMLPASAEPEKMTRMAATSTAQPYVLVLGDSITFRSQDNVHALHPDWVVDGVPGRRIDTLDVFAQLMAVQNAPETLVIALGTNSNDLWTKADFDPILTSVPATTNVIFVTVYRDPNIWPLAADRMYRISEWMKQIKAERPNTDVADWRGLILNHPELALLEDGVHPSDPLGQDTLAEMIHNAWGRLHP